jgi:hypothetical protein
VYRSFVKRVSLAPGSYNVIQYEWLYVGLETSGSVAELRKRLVCMVLVSKEDIF